MKLFSRSKSQATSSATPNSAVNRRRASGKAPVTTRARSWFGVRRPVETKKGAGEVNVGVPVAELPLPQVTGPADAVLTGAVIALVALGVVMVYSASAVFAHARYHDPHHFLIRQSIFALAGLSAMVALARVDYHHLRRATWPFLIVSVLLLLVTLLGLGRTAGGASRWIQIGPINIQPAEIAKVAVIGWMAYSLANKVSRMQTFWIGMAPHLLVAGVVALMCYLQPDLGSAVMIALVTFVLLFTAGARIAYIAMALVAAALGLVLAVVTSTYRMRRWMTYQSDDPFEHRYDQGYQIVESLMSFGAGGMHGVGLGDSRQKLFFLPEAHTDFISAIIGEELGFVGVVCLAMVFVLVVSRGLRAALRAPDDYGTYLAVGVSMFIGLQAFINLAVALNLLPTKGLVLPFISYGGSALLVNCAAVGVLLNVSRPRAHGPGTGVSWSAPLQGAGLGGVA